MKKVKKPIRKKRKGKNQKQATTNQSEFDWDGLIIFTIIFALFAGSFLWDGATITLAVMAGLLIALAGLTYFDSKKWPPRPLATSALGGAIGYLFAVETSANLEIVVLSVVVGLVIGFFASSWVQYVTLP